MAAVYGYKFLRIRMTSYTSGLAVIVATTSTSVFETNALLRPTDQIVTATGVAAAAVTLTLPAPGSGLFHHISRIVIERHTSALLTAGTTPLIATTTNLIGSLAFSIPAVSLTRIPSINTRVCPGFVPRIRIEL